MKTLITVGTTKYEVPETLTVEQFAAIQQFGHDNSKAQKLICATVLGAPINAFADVEEEDLGLLLAMCLVPLQALQEGTTLHQVNYKPFDLDTLTFGQFVDLDVISHRGLKTNLPELISVMYTMPIEEVLVTPINAFWPQVEAWLAYRSKLYSSYSAFFGIDENNAQTEGGTSESLDAARVWYTALMVLADEDFLKLHQVAERPVIEAMNFLAYIKDKRFRESQEQKRRNAQLKHR